MNFTSLGLDLQAVLKRTYQNLLYQSTFYNFLNSAYIGEIRRTGTPVIEVIKQIAPNVNTRASSEITNALTPGLATYSSVMVNLTDLPMDYSFRISPVVTGANILDALQGEIDLKDSEVASKIDEYGFGKLREAIVGAPDGSLAYSLGQVFEWNPANPQDTIYLINVLKANLFNRNIHERYELGLDAIAYGNYVSALTSILKFETKAGVEGVDRGEIAYAYGVEAFPINSNVLDGEVGYFAHEVGCVGDAYFSNMVEYDGNYPGFPGYFVIEGNILFGAKVVRPEAIIKLLASVGTISGTLPTTATSGTAITSVTITGASSYTAVGLPAGLTLNATSGVLSGTPTEKGTFNVAVYGIDANGNYTAPIKSTLVVS
jgi:hypothetical protein